MDKLKQYLYYIIIGIISFIALFFLPMVGSELDAAWTLPNTPSGWLVYISSKAIVSLLNILIFHCFQLQAKLNVKDNENYKKARAILIDEQKKEVLPRAPQKWICIQLCSTRQSAFRQILKGSMAPPPCYNQSVPRMWQPATTSGYLRPKLF